MPGLRRAPMDPMLEMYFDAKRFIDPIKKRMKPEDKRIVNSYDFVLSENQRSLEPEDEVRISKLNTTALVLRTTAEKVKEMYAVYFRGSKDDFVPSKAQMFPRAIENKKQKRKIEDAARYIDDPRTIQGMMRTVVDMNASARNEEEQLKQKMLDKFYAFWMFAFLELESQNRDDGQEFVNMYNRMTRLIASRDRSKKHYIDIGRLAYLATVVGLSAYNHSYTFERIWFLFLRGYGSQWRDDHVFRLFSGNRMSGGKRRKAVTRMTNDEMKAELKSAGVRGYSKKNKAALQKMVRSLRKQG